MNIIKTLLPAILVVAACNSSVKNSQKVDSTAVNMEQSDTTLTARMTISPVVSKDGPLEMNFTVYNQTDSTRTFCKWHTPFEPLMSKYLDITINNQEVAYKGPMAKRMMPPPADSYVSVAPGDSLSV
ncbi:MAG: protease, partial [Pedobacter sp.]